MRVRFSFLATALVGALTLVQLSPAQGPPDLTPPTALIGAIMQSNTAEAKRLLASGANPNEGTLLGGTPLLLAIMMGNVEAAQALITKGADIKATDPGGATTLMWAAHSDTGDPTLIKQLMAMGVDPNQKNKAGDTALTWAMRRGQTPAVDALRQHGASNAVALKNSIESAVALLQKSGMEFSKVSSCASCHHQSLPQMAYSHARERGYATDTAVSEAQVKAVIAMYRPAREAMLAGKQNLPNPPVTVSYALLGLAAEGYKPDATTEAMAHLIATQQDADGSFHVITARPPIESSRVSGTALSLRALQLYGGSDAQDRVKRAAQWLRTAKTQTGEERAMQILGLAWAKSNGNEMKAAVKTLLAQQRPDGGWGQLTTLESDAYATGQALVALQAAGVPVTDAAYQRGVGFLLRTQRPDGSWLVRSRAIPFQPYKESGFPYGKDQWISAAGTSWAVMALSLADPQAAMIQLSKAD